MSEISNGKIMLGLSAVPLLVGVGLISSGLLLGRKFQLIGPGAAMAGGGVIWFAGEVCEIFFEKRNKNTVWVRLGDSTYIPHSSPCLVMVDRGIIMGNAQLWDCSRKAQRQSTSESAVSQQWYGLG